MPNVSSFGAQTDNAVVSGTVTDRQMIIPEIPPQGLMSVGPRVTPNFIKEPWSKLRSYNFFDVVKNVAGSSYIAIKPVVPTNTELTDEEFWFKWSDPDAKFDELQEVVKTFNDRLNGKAPINHASEETIYGIGNEVNYGHVQLSDDANSSYNSNQGVAATPKLAHDVAKSIVYKPEDYKEASEENYTNAFSRIMQMIEAAGSGTVLGNGIYNGAIEVNQNNVCIIGGTYTDGLNVNIKASANNEPSNIVIKSCHFKTGNNNGITLTNGTGIKIIDCEFTQTVNASGIYAKANPGFNQQLKQTIISNCRFYGGYSVYFESTNLVQNSAFKYFTADTTITNCEMVNLIGNIYMTGADGFVVSNNTMFLSLGDSKKMDNIYADMVSMPVITGNQLFEAGRCGIYIGRGQNGNISSNNIIWPNQYVKLAGIYIASGKVSPVDNLAIMSVTNNVIDHPVGDGIFIGKQAVFCNANNIAYAGSKDHWKGAGEPPATETYAINAQVQVINAFMNSTLGGAGFKFLDSKDIKNNVNMLNFGNEEYYQASYRFFGMDNPTDISNGTPVKYNSKMPMLIVVNKSSIPVDVLKGDATNAPKIGCIMCYQQRCTIGDHTLEVQKPEFFLIYGGNINWFK